MKLSILAFALLASTAAIAADDSAPRIVVGGNGIVDTPPDRAVIGYTIHGEGTTSDEAVAAMVAKGKAIESGTARMAGGAPARGGQMSIKEVRGAACTRAGYQVPARLSTGDCAIIGYVADVWMEIRTPNVKDAGTITGLIGRLGGVDPRVQRYTLADEGAARARALAVAIADARAQAEALAAGAHVTLGKVVTISDNGAARPFVGEITVSASRVAAPPPPPPPPPVEVPLQAQPIETQVHVQMVFAIGE